MGSGSLAIAETITLGAENDWAPYAIGLVEFPEGIRVMGMLSGVEPDAVRIGDTYVLGSTILYHDEEGVEVRTHVFERDAGGSP